jgi:proline iminopeptidase
MPERFPPIEPYDTGMLDVGDGQRVYWEASGNPAGKPAVALHGGPGSGSTPGRRRSFDPDAYRLVQFDQRGRGRSTPSVADLGTSLEANTTEHLIGDIERLRVHLGIGRWLVWGASWGVTLGLGYAQRYPERVTEMVLVSCTMTRPSDVHWLYHEAGRFFPEQWRRYADGGGNADDLVAAYDGLLNASPDPDVRARAARDWCDWEDAVTSLEEGWTPYERYAWPGSELDLVRTGHHGGDEMTEHMMTALNRFAQT